ncbi:MAG: diaminopimelate epimerase [Streptosporangiaceae bacterium]|nr:diaminopimelate epimerase [Streptosporangiaceae bacterium]
MAEILKAHGSRNDIFIAQMTPGDFGSDADLRDFVRALCDRSGPLGSDGIYFYDAGPVVPRAWFFNPDGSSAEFCGNGMRGLGRVVLEQRDAERAEIQSGSTRYTVSRGGTSPEGVRQIRLEHPRVDFTDIEVRISELDPSLTFTALTVPNPHLIAVVDKYVESGLVGMGETLARRHGPNLSVLLPVAETEIFVRTFERGAGLTPSCGSGMAAARAVYSRLGHAAQEQPVIIHNAGGAAQVSLRDWRPVLQGNATLVYRADVDPRAPLPAVVEVEVFDAEAVAYSLFEETNVRWLTAHGIETHLPDISQ